MELFIHPDPMASELSGREISCMVDGGLSCTTPEFWIFIATGTLLIILTVLLLHKHFKGDDLWQRKNLMKTK